MKKFDLCFSNPPYNHIDKERKINDRNTDLKILNVIHNYVKEIIVVHPSTWLLDKKNVYWIYKKAKDNFSKKLKSCDIFDANSVFGTSMLATCVISHIDTNHPQNGKIKVDYLGNKYQANDINEISKFDYQIWINIIQPIIKKIEQYMNNDKNKNIWDNKQRIKNEKETPKNKFYFQCRSIVPYSGGNDVFDSLIQINSPNSRYIVNYSDLDFSSTGNRIKYYFDSLNEVNNFIDYLRTDFVRFYIHIYKNNQNFHGGELRLVPWMDFTQPWTDYDLYSYFCIDLKIIQYIESFLPDYFGLRGGTI